MRKRGVIIAVAVAVMCSGHLASYALPTDAPAGIVRIDLKDYGWEPPPRQVEFEWHRSPVAIDHSGRVLVGMAIGGPPKLATRQHPSFTYRILRFTTGGNLDATLNLPTNNWHENGLYLDDRGDVMAIANGKLQVCLPHQPPPAKAEDWETIAECGPYCRLAQSPSRKTLLLDHSSAQSDGSDLMIVASAAETGPRVIGHCKELDTFMPLSIADSAAFDTKGGGQAMPQPRLVRWPLCNYAQRTEVPALASGAVFPLNTDTVAIAGYDEIAVQSTSGEQKFVLKMRKRDVAENIFASSEDGSRFAVSIATWRGVVDWLDVGGHIAARRIAVYDSATGREIVAIPVSPKTLPNIAMSPDGHELAILQQNSLMIAKLP